MQQHGSKCCAHRHTLDPGGGIKWSNHIFFSESSNVAYQIKGNLPQSTMKASMLFLHTPSIPGVGSKCQIVFFFVSENGHVACKINVKEVKTNMQGNTLNVHTLLTTWVGLKGQLLKLCTCKCIFY